MRVTSLQRLKLVDFKIGHTIFFKNGFTEINAYVVHFTICCFLFLFLKHVQHLMPKNETMVVGCQQNRVHPKYRLLCVVDGSTIFNIISLQYA